MCLNSISYKLRIVILIVILRIFLPNSICFLRVYPLGNQAARGKTIWEYYGTAQCRRGLALLPRRVLDFGPKTVRNLWRTSDLHLLLESRPEQKKRITGRSRLELWVPSLIRDKLLSRGLPFDFVLFLRARDETIWKIADSPL